MAGASNIRAGRAYVEMTTKDAALRAGLARVSKTLKTFGAGVRTLGLGMAAAGAAGGAAILAAARNFAQYGDEIADMSQRTGLSAEALSQLGFAAEQSGADLDALEKGVRAMQRTIDNASSGMDSAAEALHTVGTSAKDLAGLSPEVQLERIADGLAAIPDPGTRAATAMRVFGRAGTSLIPMLEGGAAGMRALRREADALGLTISGDQAKAASDLADAWNRLRRVQRAVAITIGGAVAPMLLKTLERTTAAAVAAGRWVREHKELAVIGLKVAAGLAAAGAAAVILGTGMIFAGAVVSTAVSALVAIPPILGAVGAAIAALLSPAGLAVSAAIALGTAVVYYSGAGGAALQWLRDQFKALAAHTRPAIDAVVNALRGGDISAAANVFWGELAYAWAKGTAALQVSWGTMVHAVLESWNNLWAGIQTAAAIAFANIKKTAIDTGAILSKAGVSVEGTWRKVWAWVSADSLTEASEQINAITAEQDAAKKLIGDIATAERGAVDEQLGQDLRKVLQDFDDAQAKLDAAGSDRMADSLAKLNEAKAALDKAIAEANAAAPLPDAAGAPGGLQKVLDDISSMIGAGGLTSRGTFNPSGVRDLGTRTLDRIAESSKETAANTKRLIREVQESGLTFD